MAWNFQTDVNKETSKSKLLGEIIPEISEKKGEINVAKDQCVYVIDMIAQMRVCLSTVPNTFEQLILKFIQYPLYIELILFQALIEM